MSYTNPIHPYIIPAEPPAKKYYPPASLISYPYPYGNFCDYRFFPYNYPFDWGGEYGYQYNNNLYNNYRTPYYPFGPYKVGPYY